MRFPIFILGICLPGMIAAQNLKPANHDSLAVYTNRSLIMHDPSHPKIQSFIVPAVLIGYGMVSLGNNAIRDLDFSNRAELQEDHPLFANHLDNYLRYVPMAAVYGLNLAGVKGKHGVIDQTGIYVLSFAIMGSSTTLIKHLADRPRPDGADNYSFPSGHAATAFAAAEFLNQEYRDVSPWIGYAGYTVATATGVLRMYNNRHWLSDVVAGAGIGIASTKLAYIVYPHLRELVIGKQNIRYSVVPMYQQKAAGISFNGTF